MVVRLKPLSQQNGATSSFLIETNFDIYLRFNLIFNLGLMSHQDGFFFISDQV